MTIIYFTHESGGGLGPVRQFSLLAGLPSSCGQTMARAEIISKSSSFKCPSSRLVNLNKWRIILGHLSVCMYVCGHSMW